MNIYIITGGRAFADISDWALDHLGSVEYQQMFLQRKWMLARLNEFFLAHSNDGGNDIKFVFGDARGVDTVAWDFCRDGFISYNRYKADWDSYGRAAGPIRNAEMLKENITDLKGILTFPGGKGTAHMVKLGEQHAIPITRYIYE